MATVLGHFEEIQKMSKTNMDATKQSFDALSKSAQVIASEMAEYSKRSFENGTQAMEKLLSVKSLDKAIEVQSEYAKAAYEDYVAQTTKLGELYTDLAKGAFKPYEGYLAKTSTAE